MISRSSSASILICRSHEDSTLCSCWTWYSTEIFHRSSQWRRLRWLLKEESMETADEELKYRRVWSLRREGTFDAVWSCLGCCLGALSRGHSENTGENRSLWACQGRFDEVPGFIPWPVGRSGRRSFALLWCLCTLGNTIWATVASPLRRCILLSRLLAHASSRADWCGLSWTAYSDPWRGAWKPRGQGTASPNSGQWAWTPKCLRERVTGFSPQAVEPSVPYRAPRISWRLYTV